VAAHDLSMPFEGSRLRSTLHFCRSKAALGISTARTQIIMLTALYYPHTTLRDPCLLKTALLLWDRLEFITPRPDYRLESYDGNKDVDEALEIVGAPLFPSWEQQQQAHAAIEDLATSPLSKEFLWEEADPTSQFLVYPQKFLPETWDVLKRTGLAVPNNSAHLEDWSMRRNFGLAIMSILADACAGSQKRTVTDQVSSYNLLARSIANIHGGSFGTVSSAATHLVTIALKIVDADQFTLKELIDFRKQESSTSGHQVRRLRHNFMKAVDDYITRISGCEGRQGDIREIERQYEQAMRDDLLDLKDLLKRKASDTILSRDVGVGILAIGGMMVTPWTLPTAALGIGALVKMAKGYRAERRDALSKHAMSWLFTMKQSRQLNPY
jgi:hypothetical protein